MKPLKPSQQYAQAPVTSAGPGRPGLLEQLSVFISPSLQPKTAIASSVGIQVSSLPGGNRQISTRGLPSPLGSGAAGSRIYAHQCCGFQVSKAEGQCDVKNIGFALPSTAESWPVVLGMEKIYRNFIVFSWVATMGLIVQETVQGTLDKIRVIQAPWSLERAQYSMAKAWGSFLGLVWVCCLGPAGSRGST